MVIIRNRMARHELQVAKFYFDKKAYLASANRCKKLLKDYPRAVTNIEALELMKENYRLLGMNQNARDTQKVIDMNKKLKAENQASNDEQDSFWSKMSETLGKLFD
mgnify:FL=1